MFRSIAGAVLVLSVASLVMADEPKGIAGPWVPTEMHQSGQKLAEAYLKVTKLDLSGGKYRLSVGAKTATGTFKLDPKADPQAIDITIEAGDGKGESYLGRYKLDGDTLTVCHALDGKDRPAKLESTAENGALLVVYKRAK